MDSHCAGLVHLLPRTQSIGVPAFHHSVAGSQVSCSLALLSHIILRMCCAFYFIIDVEPTMCMWLAPAYVCYTNNDVWAACSCGAHIYSWLHIAHTLSCCVAGQSRSPLYSPATLCGASPTTSSAPVPTCTAAPSAV